MDFVHSARLCRIYNTMSFKFSVPLTVRDAIDADLAVCQQLDLSYETEYAWQMDVRDEEGAIVVGFRTVRLPRLMRVVYPRDPQGISPESLQKDQFLVAETSGVVCGYLLMRIDLGRATAWITDLAIGRPWRRKKIGSALLMEAYNRVQARDIQRLTVETQTKNYPGIAFCQKNGLTFCGFNDRYYPNQDIALFFGQNVRHE